MMWNEPRKSYRSPQKTTTQPQRLSTTCLVTPGKCEKPSVRQFPRQCPLHFSQYSHVCLNCRKTICLRCALTYCQQHVVRTEQQAVFSLRQELLKLQVLPRIEQMQAKLGQSKERQQFLQKKVLRLIENIESHFQYVCQMLAKKKLQIIQYYDQQFQKYLQEHRNYDEEIKQRIHWLRECTLEQDASRLSTIEQIDGLSMMIKKATLEEGKMEKKITGMLMGKQKIKTEKLWTEQNLQRVLLEVECIPFKLQSKGNKGSKRKKRVTTENAGDHTFHNIKSSSNSRFPSSRKPGG